MLNSGLKFFTLISFSSLLMLFSMIAVAKNGAELNKYQCKVISKSQAISNAKRRLRGKVVAANLVKNGDRSVYKVRMLINKKRVKTITIPACQ